MKKRVLIVEDDNDINNILSESLRANGFDCLKAYSGTEALLYIKEELDLVILDLMLPGLPGEEVIKKIKEEKEIPVLILSSKDSMDSKLALLNGGADDYMTKPFNIDELLARANILTRRKNKSEKDTKKEYKNISLDDKSFRALYKDKDLDLTKSEYKILELLMSNPRQVFTKEIIYEYVFGDFYMANDNSVNVHISNIRKKIKKYTDDDYIKTVWGIGFKLDK